MSKATIRYLILYCLLLPIQVIVLNRLVLFNCAIPLAFIYLLTVLPASFGTNRSLSLGFVTGLIVDAFMDTYGLNALCCTILAFVRKPVLHMYILRDEEQSVQPCDMHSLGMAVFLKYNLTMSLIYCAMLFMVEAFSFFDVKRLLLRTVASTIYTFVIIAAISGLYNSRREKRL